MGGVGDFSLTNMIFGCCSASFLDIVVVVDSGGIAVVIPGAEVVEID